MVRVIERNNDLLGMVMKRPSAAPVNLQRHPAPFASTTLGERQWLKRIDARSGRSAREPIHFFVAVAGGAAGVAVDAGEAASQ